MFGQFQQQSNFSLINDENKTNEENEYCSLCDKILYCQLQNGCMTTEYEYLCDDISLNFDWVSNALFNKKPV